MEDKARKPAVNGRALAVPDPDRQVGKLKRIGGSKSDDWNNEIAAQTIGTLWTAHADADGQQSKMQAAIACLAGIRPTDEIEGMLAAQMIGLHNAAMECMRRAMIPEQTFEGRKENLNQANKLARTSTQLVDALNKHRGKGQQRVTVEHVHVNEGGQAIVGAVAKGGGNDGG